jgi:hypothetical protein
VTGHPTATPTIRPAGLASTAERSSPGLSHPVRRLLSLVRSAHRTGRSLRSLPFSTRPVLSGYQAGRSLPLSMRPVLSGPVGRPGPNTAQQAITATGRTAAAGVSDADPGAAQRSIAVAGRTVAGVSGVELGAGQRSSAVAGWTAAGMSGVDLGAGQRSVVGRVAVAG